MNRDGELHAFSPERERARKIYYMRVSFLPSSGETLGPLRGSEGRQRSELTSAPSPTHRKEGGALVGPPPARRARWRLMIDEGLHRELHAPARKKPERKISYPCVKFFTNYRIDLAFPDLANSSTQMQRHCREGAVPVHAACAAGLTLQNRSARRGSKAHRCPSILQRPRSRSCMARRSVWSEPSSRNGRDRQSRPRASAASMMSRRIVFRSASRPGPTWLRSPGGAGSSSEPLT